MPYARHRLASAVAATVLGLTMVGCGGGGGLAESLAEQTDPPAPAPPPAAKPVPTPSGTPQVWADVRQSGGGTIRVTTLQGPKSAIAMKVWVWTPPEYDEPAYANSVFPVLTLYPGGNGAGYNTWANPELDMPAQVAALSKQRKSHPFILVMPAMQLVKEDETECMDIPGQPKVGTFQAEDVPAMVRANFRVPDTRDGWGVMGASSGGFCSMHLAFNKPDQFKAAAGIGAYFTGDSKLLEPHRAWRDSISPATLAGQGKVDTDLLLVVGADEEEENRKVDDFLPKVKPPVKVETYVNPDGKHLTKDFKRAIPKTLEFFTRELTGPTPG